VSKFVLLDRDGVINQRVPDGYVTEWAQFIFMPGALEGLRFLKENGYSAIIVSNQACVGKGLLSPSKLDEITQQFLKEIQAQGGAVCAVYYCPHREEEGCDCRKPKPGLLRRAQAEHHFDFADTLLIGDSESDLQAAHAVGSPALLISNDDTLQFGASPYRPRGVFPDLLAAARFLVEREE